MPKKYPTFSLNVTRKVNSQRPQNYWLKSKHSVQSDAIALPETHVCSCHTPVWDMAWHTGTCASMRSAICMPSIGYWHAQYRLLACPVYAEIDCWLECWTFDQKFASSNPGRSGERIFFSRVNFVCWLLFSARSTPLLPQWHVKDPDHSAKSAGGRLHLNMHTPLTQRSQSRLTMPLSRHRVGTCQETSSQATSQGTLDHSRFSSLSHCGLILT